MARLGKIRALVDIIDVINTKQEEDDTLIGLSDLDPMYGMPVEKDLAIIRFIKKYPKLSKTEVDKIYGAAKKFEYIVEVPNRYIQDKIKLAVTHDKGLNIIQRRFKMPSGYFREVLTENKQLLSVIGLVSAIIICISTVISVIISARHL